MKDKAIAGRVFGEVYRVSGRHDLHDYLIRAVEASGGRVLFASRSDRAPVYIGVQVDSDERIGMLVYPFRVTRRSTKNRPRDEVRGQLRYGSEHTWDREHPVARDIAGVDITLIVGVDIEDGILLGLDASLWNPLPMGISFYAKKSHVQAAQESGWHVWEKENHGGSKRVEPRSPTRFETVVAFTPDRLIDYARLERRATDLRLDPPLRYATALSMKDQAASKLPRSRHVLEEQFSLSSQQILDIISDRNRLSVAVRGGVAEFHLEKVLAATTGVVKVEQLDKDAKHDFNVTFSDGKKLRVECKNASPETYASGEFKVEVQKTRGSKGDPASRYYLVDAFDVVAACVYSATGQWDFRFCFTSQMTRHRTYSDRLAPVHRITADWTPELTSSPVAASPPTG